MKHLFSVLLIGGLASCSAEKDPTPRQSLDFSVELDTVKIDAGDELIYVGWNLTSSGESLDGKYLYNFRTGSNSPALELINLESAKLERVIQMTLDGPNGLRSPFVMRVYVQEDGTFFLSDNYELYHFNQNGTKLFTLNYAKHEFEGEKLPDELRITLNETLSKDGKTLLSLYGDQPLEKSPFGLAVFDLEKGIFSYQPLDVFEELDPYRVNIYRDGSPAGSKFASIRLFLKGDSLVFSNSVKNEVGFYGLKTDSLSKKSYSSKYTSQQAKPNYPNRIETEQQYDELLKQTDREVNYGRLFFDGQNDVYWRFTKEMDRVIGDSVVHKTVLTAFDPYFNQLAEKLLPADFVLPSKYFVRKGMIYTYLNIEDEVAFVRIIPEFGP